MKRKKKYYWKEKPVAIFKFLSNINAAFDT